MDEETRQPHLPILSVVVETAVKLREDGHKVIIVSSGAIGVGMRHVNLAHRPKRLATLQVRNDSQLLPHHSPAPPDFGAGNGDGDSQDSCPGRPLTCLLSRRSRPPGNASSWRSGTACSAI
ncbi:hypothetical protein IMZ48_27210 [Candidatus Bathyarchaeota archaeon]|nr:hypothetical protein [Candidatus Bathyarchaeota archaeon]